MKWLLPTNLFWVVGHILMVIVGIFLTIIALDSSYRDVWLGVGGSLIASGVAGEILYLYVSSSQDTKDRLDLIAKAGLLRIFPTRSVRIREEYHSRKTTFSDYMANYESVRVYEASNVLRGIAEEVGVIPSNSEEALDFLGEVGWDAVARKVADYIDKDDSRLSVVTGLRTPEELLLLKSRFPSARIVLINADQRIRFERHLRRARDRALTDMKSFSSEDEQQKRFGTLRIASDIAEITIHNDGSRDQYSKRIEEVLDLISKTPETRKLQANRSLSELHRSLKALLAIGSAATCEEISKQTAKLGSPVRKYNTNRALKAVPEFASRLERKGDSLKYRPTDRSLSLLKLLDLLSDAEALMNEQHRGS